MVIENLVGPGDRKTRKSGEVCARTCSELGNDQVIHCEGFILITVGVFSAPQPVAVAEMLEVTQLHQGNTIRFGLESRCNWWPGSGSGGKQAPALKDV